VRIADGRHDQSSCQKRQHAEANATGTEAERTARPRSAQMSTGRGAAIDPGPATSRRRAPR
jgi:hypothetical protein